MESNNNNGLSNALVNFAYVFATAGIVIPISIISELGIKLINAAPELLIPPLYSGLLLIVLGGVDYIFSAVLSKNHKEIQWVVNGVSNFGYLLFIIGTIGFFMLVSKTNNSFAFIEKGGFVMAILFLLFNVQVGLLCLGSVAFYNNYFSNGKINLFENEMKDSKYIFCQQCGEKIDVTDGLEYCPNCNSKL